MHTGLVSEIKEFTNENNLDYLIKKLNEITKTLPENENDKLKLVDSIELITTYVPDDNNPSAILVIDEIRNKIKNYRGKIRIYKENTPSKLPANILQLIIGSLNGLTMALLFGRYVSMEHSLQNIDKGKYSEYIRWGIIIILPIYALAQPLFGSFDIDAFGPPMNFQNIVFFICLIGKMFFLYVTWSFIKKRWMHYWLHSILINHSVPKDFYDCFEIETKKDFEEKESTISTDEEK
ncbi:MAG: hypothetical protein WA584_21760 [Pyrinomonadaceae bacterium]